MNSLWRNPERLTFGKTGEINFWRNDTMKSDTTEKITRYLISLVCFTAYFALLLALFASAHRTSLHNMFPG